jgi:energy-coupling factor transporter transmembrane protein EcfT
MPIERRWASMLAVIALLLVLLFFGAGFAMKALWIVAVVLLVMWLLGFVARGADRRWYYW